LIALSSFVFANKAAPKGIIHEISHFEVLDSRVKNCDVITCEYRCVCSSLRPGTCRVTHSAVSAVGSLPADGGHLLSWLTGDGGCRRHSVTDCPGSFDLEDLK